MPVTLEDLQARMCVLERVVGEHGERPFSAHDAFMDVRDRIMTLQLRMTSMRLEMEELVDEVHDLGGLGVAVAAIASHLGVAVPGDAAQP
ncbi:hypothetical protein ABZ942_43295 [Nocardia sp. NPDC046473]|uniref:hypothetical protein n=1 Tax=Nocardia sp. NPDC046473 TaxID=3155733 RepID=UPI0033F4F41D